MTFTEANGTTPTASANVEPTATNTIAVGIGNNDQEYNTNLLRAAYRSITKLAQELSERI